MSARYVIPSDRYVGEMSMEELIDHVLSDESAKYRNLIYLLVVKKRLDLKDVIDMLTDYSSKSVLVYSDEHPAGIQLSNL